MKTFLNWILIFVTACLICLTANGEEQMDPTLGGKKTPRVVSLFLATEEKEKKRGP